MRLWIFCVFAFCASGSLAQRGITMEYYDEMYQEPFSTEDKGEAKVEMEHLDNVDNDEGKSKEDLENAENGHDTIIDYQFEDNRSSESNDKQNIVEVPTESMNSPASDIESEDNDDGEEDSENDGSETDSIVEESYELNPPADGKDIEDNRNGYDENSENYRSEAENVNENAKEPADFRADSEDIVEKNTEYKENKKNHSSDASKIVEQQTELMNSPASDKKSDDDDDDEEENSKNNGFEIDGIVEESNELVNLSADGKDIKDNDNGYDGNPENYNSEAENVNDNSKEPTDFRAYSKNIEEEDTEHNDNQKSHNSDASKTVEPQSEPLDSPASDLESKDNDDGEEDSENYDSEIDSIVEESYELDLPADGKNNEDEVNSHDGNSENYSSEAGNVNEKVKEPFDFRADSEDTEEEDAEYKENLKSHYSDASEIVEQQTETINLPASDKESEENDDDEEDSENYGSETDDIVKESNEFMDSSADGEVIKDKYSGYDENLENDYSKVNGKEEESKYPVDSPVEEENRKYYDAGQEENQQNDNFEEGDNIVEDPLIPKNDEDFEENTSSYEENDDCNIGNTVEKPKKPVDSPNDGDYFKYNDTDNKENQESYDSEALKNGKDPTELGDSLANDENSVDSDALVTESQEPNHSRVEEEIKDNIINDREENEYIKEKQFADIALNINYNDFNSLESLKRWAKDMNEVNNKIFKGHNYNDFSNLIEEFYKNTNDSTMDQNRNYDEDSAFKPLTDTAISEEINGTAVNFEKVTPLPCTNSTITDENKDTEPSPTEHSVYVDGILFGSSDIKTIKDDGNENTTDSNMVEKTSHQNINPIPIQIPRAIYHSSEAIDYSNDELGDDISFNHKYAALYTTDATNAEENESYESSYVTASKLTHTATKINPREDVNPTTPVFEALTDETPHVIDSPYFSPYGPPAIMEYYINAQGSGIEFNITFFSVKEDSGYLLIKPGGVYASDDDAIVLQERQERVYRFIDVDRLYIKFYTGDPSGNSFRLSVRMLNGHDPWSYYEQPSLTVALGGSNPTAFDMDDEKKEDFRSLITRIAEQYIADGYIIRNTDDFEPWTNITEVTSCTNDVRDGLNCVKVTFTVTYRKYPRLSFNLTDLMRMWYTYQEEYASRLETMGLKVNWGAEIAAEKQKQHMLVVWLVTGAGVLISAVMLVVAFWFGCCKGYTRMAAHDDTERLTKKQSFPALYSEQRLTWDDDKVTKVDLDGYANIGFAEKLLDLYSDDDVKTTPSDRKTISPSDVYQV